MPRDNKSSKIEKIILHRYRNGVWQQDEDVLAKEEPLEIRISYSKMNERKTQSISVTMRTPGNDVELALGFLFTEGIIRSVADVMQAGHAAHAKTRESRNNIVQVLLKETAVSDIEKLKRNFYTTSSCGVCGKESIDAVKTECPVYPERQLQIPLEVILTLPYTLRQQQNVFAFTGGIHAAALFDTNGHLLLLREDVGRHNALDKLIGSALFTSEQNTVDPADCILLLSGRASFELIQKAAMAGISIVCAVGAPSSLAVEMADDLGITLIGFLREERFNVYSGNERVISKS